MLLRRPVRYFIAVLLVAAQPLTAAFAVQTVASGAPCPVHANLDAAPSAGTQDAVHPGNHGQHSHHSHAGHMSGSADAAPGEGGESMDWTAACCVLHLTALSADAAVSKDPVRPLAQGEQAGRDLEARFPAADDPPPRTFL